MGYSKAHREIYRKSRIRSKVEELINEELKDGQVIVGISTRYAGKT